MNFKQKKIFNLLTLNCIFWNWIRHSIIAHTGEIIKYVITIYYECEFWHKTYNINWMHQVNLPEQTYTITDSHRDLF